MEPQEIPTADDVKDQRSSSQPLDSGTELLLITALQTISGILVQMTKIDEIALTQEETRLLAETWKPFIKEDISPVWAAVITTVVIVGGKVAIYAQVKGKEHAVQAG